LQHTVWQNVYIQRIVKIKSTAFLYLPGMDSTIIEVGALQHTRSSQCTIKEARKWNAFFAQIFKWVSYSSTATCWITKLLDKGCWFIYI